MKKDSKTWFNDWQKGLREVNRFVAEEQKLRSKADKILALEGNLQHALISKKGSFKSSGLVDMHKIFAKSKS